MAEKVADAASKIVDGKQGQLFEPHPSETVEALHPRTEMQANYEDFEAAFAMQTAGGARPEAIVFDTVVNGVQKRVSIAYLVAKTLTMPAAKSVRILVLQQHLKKNVVSE